MSVQPRNGGFPQQMPTVDFGWGGYFPAAEIVRGFYWDYNADCLYTQTPEDQFNVFINVPRDVAQKFVYTIKPDEFYAGVCNSYKACLLTEECVPLITDDGEYLIYD
jgi:hypothetical protein